MRARRRRRDQKKDRTCALDERLFTPIKLMQQWAREVPDVARARLLALSPRAYQVGLHDVVDHRGPGEHGHKHDGKELGVAGWLRHLH